MPIPDALRATVLRRLWRLERTDRALVMRASVIGREFDVHVLAAVAVGLEERVLVALERACTLQILVPCGESRYSFRHALTQDIIYAEFIDGRTRPIHRRIARVLERRLRCGEPVLEALAHHAWAAGDFRRAIRYNELAGDEAAAVHAYDDARKHYTRARSAVEIGSLGYSRLTLKLNAADG